MSDMATWQTENPRKRGYCERIMECHSRNCDNKGNADFAVIGDDLNEYCSESCAIDEKIEVEHE